MSLYAQDPDDTLDYVFDFATALEAGETISTASVTGSGFTVALTSATTNSVTAWITAAQTGSRTVECLVTTNQGRTFGDALQINVSQRA